MIKANIHITLKKGVLDAQGKAVESAIEGLDVQGIDQVRVGKFIELTLENSDNASEQVEMLCEKLLVNHVMEDYSYTLEERVDQ